MYERDLELYIINKLNELRKTFGEMYRAEDNNFSSKLYRELKRIRNEINLLSENGNYGINNCGRAGLITPQIYNPISYLQKIEKLIWNNLTDSEKLWMKNRGLKEND